MIPSLSLFFSSHTQFYPINKMRIAHWHIDVMVGYWDTIVKHVFCIETNNSLCIELKSHAQSSRMLVLKSRAQ